MPALQAVAVQVRGLRISPEVLEERLLTNFSGGRDDSEPEVQCLKHHDFGLLGSHAEIPTCPSVQERSVMNNCVLISD
jgi:hypothetical protein